MGLDLVASSESISLLELTDACPKSKFTGLGFGEERCGGSRDGLARQTTPNVGGPLVSPSDAKPKTAVNSAWSSSTQEYSIHCALISCTC